MHLITFTWNAEVYFDTWIDYLYQKKIMGK